MYCWYWLHKQSAIGCVNLWLIWNWCINFLACLQSASLTCFDIYQYYLTFLYCYDALVLLLLKAHINMYSFAGFAVIQ